jgi:plastocyanin
MRRCALATLAAISLTAGCGGSDGTTPITPPTVPKDTIFTIGIASFSPNQLTVSKGATVVFALGFDGTGHDVRFNAAGAPADIPVVVRQNVPRTFAVAGSFSYICPTHPQMTGMITVQ